MKTKMLILILCGFCSSFVCAEGDNANQQIDDQFFLKFNSKAPFLFMGKVDPNRSSGGGAAMLYPGDNALVFFTAILTHAVIEGGMENSKLTKEQEEANKILTDYQDFITKFNVPENAVVSPVDVNLDGISKKMSLATDLAARETAKWEMTISPIFFMTQNQGSLILYNKVVLQENAIDKTDERKRNKRAISAASKRGGTNKNEKVVVIISDPIADVDYRKHWSSNEGEVFLTTLKNMFKESLSLVIANKFIEQKAQSPEQVTVKYMEDGIKKIERGYVISSSCKRTLFTSLSGEIKSVPNMDFLGCGSAG